MTRLIGWPSCLILVLQLGLLSCVHRIHISPEPDHVAAAPIPLSVRVDVPYFLLEGADHMPGITLLEWPWKDFWEGVVEYIRKRGSFAEADSDRGDATLSITARLMLRSHERYLYRIRLDAELRSPQSSTSRTYVAEAEATGSRVRWVTASDQEPIAEAVRLALNDLLTKIEADRALILAAAKS